MLRVTTNNHQAAFQSKADHPHKCVYMVSGTDMTSGISCRHAYMPPLDDVMCWPSGPVVFMHSLKRRGGRIILDFYCSCDLDPMTFIYELDPHSSEIHPDVNI